MNYETKGYWNTYFPGLIYDLMDQENKDLLKDFISFFQKCQEAQKIEFVDTPYKQEKILSIDCQKFANTFKNTINNQLDLLAVLEAKSSLLIPIIEFAAHFVCFDTEDENLSNSDESNQQQSSLKQDPKIALLNVDSMKINARFFNYGKVALSVKDLKAKLRGKFFSVRGTVISVGTVKPIITEMNLECKKCGTVFPHPFAQGGRYLPPTKCPTLGCKSKTFAPLFSDIAHTKHCDYQKIKIQESMTSFDDSFEGGDVIEGGRTPRSIECELTRDLVESCVPGDEVVITGTLDAISMLQYQQDKFGKPIGQQFNKNRGGGRGGGRGGADAGKSFLSSSEVGAKRGEKTLYFMYFAANSIHNLKHNPDFQSNISAVAISKNLEQTAGSAEEKNSFVQKPDENTHTEYQVRELSVKDYQAINFIYHQPDKFKLFVHSVSPQIYGHEIVKAAIVLTLFGGASRATKKKMKGVPSSSNNKAYDFFTDVQDDKQLQELAVRSDPHLLIVGDPGMGKSQMLLSASYISPRGIYVCGNTTSTSGLTVTVVKDPQSSDWVLEAGALVLADEGCCCIDEFDKMKHEHQALLEAMEQQMISVAKAGIVVSLPSRCCVIAAANPVGGHYNFGKTISENLKINPALLSRFDLIFILVDRPNEERDKLLSDHVMKMHSTEKKVRNTSTTKDFAAHEAAQKAQKEEEEEQIGKKKGKIRVEPLRQRLKMSVEELDNFDPLPIGLFKKYIAYAKKYVPRVKLTETAKEILKDFYIKLRHAPSSKDATPITTRQLESLIRLTQARAKLELRSLATKGDAQDAIEIIKSSLSDITFDETSGNLDFSKHPMFSSTTKAATTGQMKKFMDLLKQGEKKIFSKKELVDFGQQVSFPVKIDEDFLQALRNGGWILKKYIKEQSDWIYELG